VKSKKVEGSKEGGFFFIVLSNLGSGRKEPSNCWLHYQACRWKGPAPRIQHLSSSSIPERDE
jgi:hypothetical protein